MTYCLGPTLAYMTAKPRQKYSETQLEIMARDFFGHLSENAFFNAARGCRILDTPALESSIRCQHWSSADHTSTEHKSPLFMFDESCSLIGVDLFR